jgi:aspartate-semialdehyde dehydrogenase
MNLAIIGATGNVGRKTIEILEKSKIEISNLFLVASAKSAGKKIKFKGKEIEIQDLEKYDFSNAKITFFAAGSKIAEQWATKASKKTIVIDNSKFFRMDNDVPLIVPEVNPHHVSDFKKKNIIANPNCSTIQMVTALSPLHKEFTIKKVFVSTYQAVSGAGKAAMDELFNQTKGVYVNDSSVPEQFTKKISFNVIPHIDVFMDDGSTKEEWKMSVETNKILDKNIQVTAHCVRVPVFIGHSEAIFIECEKEINEEKARSILRKADGVTVVDHRADEGYVTPAEVAGEDDVYISRIRQNNFDKNNLVFWCVSDNLRKGAALNAVQIAELLISKKLVTQK